MAKSKKGIMSMINTLVTGNKRRTKNKLPPPKMKKLTVKDSNSPNTTSMNFSNYDLIFSHPVPSSISFPSKVQELLPEGKYYALKFNVYGSFKITEEDLLKNENIQAFKCELTIENGICYLLLYIVSSVNDPLELNNRYVDSCPIKMLNINSPLYVPRRLKSYINVGHLETKLLNCRCGGYYLNGICVNCDYDSFIKSLIFTNDNSNLIISPSDLYVDVQYRCLACERCKNCAKAADKYYKLRGLDFSIEENILFAKHLLGERKFKLFKQGSPLEKCCPKHTKCNHLASTKEKFEMRNFLSESL